MGHATTTFSMDGLNYDITVFDTRGLFDTSMSNRMKEIPEYVAKYSPEGINLLLFVLKKGRYTFEEKQSFEYCTSKWKDQVSFVSALVITHCDNDDESDRQALVQELTTNPLTKEAATYMKKGIYTAGFPDTRMMKPFLHKLMQEDIEEDRQKILKLIANCDATVPTSDLHMW